MRGQSLLQVGHTVCVCFLVPTAPLGWGTGQQQGQDKALGTTLATQGSLQCLVRGNCGPTREDHGFTGPDRARTLCGFLLLTKAQLRRSCA